ncbi:MAG TPA: glycoside hydrolase family 13 protein [Streptosporangiaceae bacterium]
MPDLGSKLPGAWWRGAAIYQLYVRSFADGNGDGIGDLGGVRAHLRYLADLGIDAIWFNPWYPSPMSDAGYDIADYRGIDPVFGTLAEAQALIDEAHGHGLRIIIDVVPNHGSDQHPWFREALAAAPGSAQRARFWFRPGRGPGGDRPPNDWQSIFGGPAWTRFTEPDGTPGEWYLHLFAPEQPDFNWASPEVRAEFEDVLRFWLDRGADGIRIDSAALLTKDPQLRDIGPDGPGRPDGGQHPFVDRDDVHEIYRSWRALTDGYGDRVLIGEIWLPDATRLARYLSPGELHTVFNFPYLCCAWDPGELRRVIDRTRELHSPAGAPATWVLANHDVDREVSRYGRPDTSFSLDARDHSQPVDIELGTRRARAAALLTMALPGSVYVYQGEELGLWEVEDIPDELRQDPIWHRTGGADPGRDGSRVPLPWAGAEPPFGFSPAHDSAPPWLPQPKEWRDLTVQAEAGDPGSMLELYRGALRIRGTEPALGDGPMRWLPSAAGVLAFERGDRGTGTGRVHCLVNLSAAPVDLPGGAAVLLASGPLEEDRLPADTAVWLRPPG